MATDGEEDNDWSYHEIECIGRGSSGSVFLTEQKGVNGSASAVCVVKKIPMPLLSKRQQRAALQECRILRCLAHPHVVTYVDSFFVDDTLHLAMEYCSGGDLSSVIRRCGRLGQRISEEQIMVWTVHMCKGLAYIHKQRILHRDLKTSNVFLTNLGVVKIGDFGIARVLENSQEKARTMVGTPFYMSPEVCENQPYDLKTDVWAMGVIIYELATLRRPFEADSLLGVVFKIINEGELAACVVWRRCDGDAQKNPTLCYKIPDTPPLPAEYSAELQELVQQLMSKHAESRPTAQEILHRAVLQRFIDVESTSAAVQLLELLATLPQSSYAMRRRSSRDLGDLRADGKQPPSSRGSTPLTSVRPGVPAGMKVSTSRPNSQQSKASEGIEYDETPRIHAELPAARYPLPWQSPTGSAASHKSTAHTSPSSRGSGASPPRRGGATGAAAKYAASEEDAESDEYSDDFEDVEEQFDGEEPAPSKQSHEAKHAHVPSAKKAASPRKSARAHQAPVQSKQAERPQRTHRGFVGVDPKRSVVRASTSAPDNYLEVQRAPALPQLLRFASNDGTLTDVDDNAHTVDSATFSTILSDLEASIRSEDSFPLQNHVAATYQRGAL